MFRTRRMSSFFFAFCVYAFASCALARSPQESLNSQNPFALRAERNSSNLVAPPTSNQSSPIIKPGVNNSDVVYLKNGKSARCAILSLSGRGGATICVGNETQTVPTSSFERLEISVSDDFLAGIEAFEAGRRSGVNSQFLRALTFFQQARKSTERRLEKEWATAKIVETLVALGRDDEAVVEFFLLCRVDSYSVFLPSAPLRWTNQTTISRGSNTEARRQAETNAQEWLERTNNPSGRPNPVGRLLAASVLLTSPQFGKEATEAMRDLVVCESEEENDSELNQTCRLISLLATAQLWRLALLKKPSEKEVDRWTQTLELLPQNFKLGPTALIALGRKSLAQDELAASNFLRVAALASENYALDELATNEAIDAFERIGRKEIASKLRESAKKKFGERNVL